MMRRYSFIAVLVVLLCCVCGSADAATNEMVATYGTSRMYSSLADWEAATDIDMKTYGLVFVGSTTSADTFTLGEAVSFKNSGGTEIGTGTCTHAIAASQSGITRSFILSTGTAATVISDTVTIKDSGADDVFTVSACNNAAGTIGCSEVLAIYTDSAIYDDTVTLAGATTDATYYRIIRPASGHEHKGLVANGVRFEKTQNTSLFIISESYSQIRGISGKLTSNVNSDPVTFSVSSAANGATFGECIAYASSNSYTAKNVYGFFSYNASTSYFINCIAYGCDGSGFALWGSVATFYNCTAYGNGLYGFADTGSATSTARNCLTSNNGSGAFSSIDTTQTNAESATFVDAGNGNFHLARADTTCREQGTNLTSSGVTTDIDGNARPDSTSFDIGADEYSSITRGTYRVAAATSGYADYTTFSACINDIGTLEGDMLILVDSGSYTESSAVVFDMNLAGYTLEIAPVEWPTGTIATSTANPVIITTNSNAYGFDINLPILTTGTLSIAGLALVDGGSATTMIYVRGSSATTVKLHRNVIKGGSSYGIRLAASAVNQKVFNNFVYNAGNLGIYTSANPNAATIIANNTVVDITHVSNATHGIAASSLDPVIINNLVLNSHSNSGTDFDTISNATGYNNASSDTSAADGNWGTGADNLTSSNGIDTNEVVDYSGDNFLISSSAECVDEGYDVYGSDNVVMGSYRGRRLRATDDIGADEYYGSATNLYFSQSGNDSTGVGSAANPYKTIAKLNDVASANLLPGTIIYLDKASTWNVGDSGEETLTLAGCTDGGGIAGSEIRIDGATWTYTSGGTRAKLNDTDLNHTNHMVRIEDKDHIYVYGIETYGGDSGLTITGSWNPTIDNCVSSYHTDSSVHDNIAVGFDCDGEGLSGGNATIKDCVVSYGVCGGIGVTGAGTLGMRATGGAFVDRCIAHSQAASSSAGIRTGDGWVVSDCTVYGNDHGIAVHWTPTTIRRCYIYSNTGSGIRANCPTEDVRGKVNIYNNMIKENGTGISNYYCADTAYINMFNNTFYGNAKNIIARLSTCHPKSVVVKNNIFYGSTNYHIQALWPVTGYITSDYNSFYHTGDYFAYFSTDQSWSWWQTQGKDANSLGDDSSPSFVNAGGSNDYDYKITSSSNCIDVGTATTAFDGVNTIALDYFGNSIPVDGPDVDADLEYDIGAHEWAAIIPIIMHHRRLSQ